MNLSALFARARRAKIQSGKGLLAQGREILRLRQSFGHIGPSEYFDYGLYDDAKYSEKEKASFVGWSKERSISQALNKSEWAVLALDKIAFYTFLEGAGVPYPPLKAIFDTTGRAIRNTLTCTDTTSLGECLTRESFYPVFVKPSHGNFGRGTHLLSGYDKDNRAIFLSDKTRMLVDEFTRSLETKLSQGQIFQEVIVPHPDLVTLCGRRSSTVRVVVVVDKKGPHVLCAVWKVPTGMNVIDNFHHGRTGNLVASVDIHTGTIRRVIGKGVDGEFVTVTTHPDTQRRLTDATIPYWAAVQDLCLTAARLIPGFRLLHFDVALAEKGPALLEMNYLGSLDLLQHASGTGVWSEQVATAMRDQEAHRREIVDVMKQTLQRQHGQSGA